LRANSQLLLSDSMSGGGNDFQHDFLGLRHAKSDGHDTTRKMERRRRELLL